MNILENMVLAQVSGGNDQADELVLLPMPDESSPVHREPVEFVVPSGPLAGLVGFIQPFSR